MLPDKLYVNQALQALIGFNLIIIGCIFILEMVSFYQEWKKFSLRNLSQRWRLPLACTSFVCLVLLSIDGTYEWVNWETNPDGCSLASGFITMFFVFLKQSINFFLYDRAKIIHEALQISDWKMKLLRWAIWLTIAFGVHLFFAWAYFINFVGRVSVDGDCIYITKYPEVIIAFAASDSCLNVGMLILFAAPLYLQVKSSSSLKSPATTKIKTVMRRNMVLSIVLVLIDISGLSTMAYFFITTDHNDTTKEHLVLWGNLAAVVDQTAVVIVAHAMTGGWIPFQVRVFFRYHVLRHLHRHRQVDFDSLSVNERT
jgi:hypothetical protein